MAPSKYDLAVYQGDDFARDFVFTDGTTPLDLTGYVFAAEVRAGPADTATTVLATMVCTLTDPTAGKLRVELDHVDTTALTVTSAVWDLEGTTPTGTVVTYLAGKVKITPEVTR